MRVIAFGTYDVFDFECLTRSPTAWEDWATNFMSELLRIRRTMKNQMDHDKKADFQFIRNGKKWRLRGAFAM